MARTTVDFSDVQDFEPVPKDEYPVVVDKVTYVEQPEEDKYDYLAWEMTITEGEFQGRKQWLNTSFSPKALFKLKEVLENLDLFEDELDIDYDEDTMLVTTPELEGMPAIAVVEEGKYNGRPTNNVVTLISADVPKQGAKKTEGKKPAAKAGGKKKFK